MAWRCHGSNQESLVQMLADAGIITSKQVEIAMMDVDRGLFVRKTDGRVNAYDDNPQPIGCGQTISAPHMHAHCLQLLVNHLKPGNRVLDVGSGSGYLSAVMARLVCPPDSPQQGLVVGVEHCPELVQNSIASVQEIEWAKQLMSQGNFRLICADGRRGYLSDAPYDAIHVGAAASQLPDMLTMQLAPGGRLVVPVGPVGGPQHLWVVDRSSDGRTLTREQVMRVLYVPLTSMERVLVPSTT